MSVIHQRLASTSGLIAYMMAGDGGFEHSLAVMQAYADSGVAVIEVGVPFSDPIADGPVIQAAANRSLANGFTFQKVLELIQAFKTNYDTPVILFSYLNPMLAQGDLSTTLTDVKAAGVNGCLIVDLPIEAADEYREVCDTLGLDPIFLIAQSTPDDRIEMLAAASRGMVYYVCRQGVTGVRDSLPDDVTARVALIQKRSACPVVVGFGLSTPAMISAVCDVAQGAVVGSYLVKLASAQSIGHLRDELKRLVDATQQEDMSCDSH